MATTRALSLGFRPISQAFGRAPYFISAIRYHLNDRRPASWDSASSDSVRPDLYEAVKLLPYKQYQSTGPLRYVSPYDLNRATGLALDRLMDSCEGWRVGCIIYGLVGLTGHEPIACVMIATGTYACSALVRQIKLHRIKVLVEQYESVSASTASPVPRPVGSKELTTPAE